MRLPTHYTILVAILAVALGVRVAWAAFTDAEPNFETGSAEYVLLARSIRDGEGFSLAGEPTAWRAPGYPLLLAALAPGQVDNGDAQAVNILAGVLAAGLAYLIARRLFGRSVGLVSSALVALLPSHVMLTGVALPDAAFTAVLLAGAWLAILALDARGRARMAYGTLSGVAFGFGALITPAALVLPVAMAAFAVWRERRRALAFAIPAVLGATLLVTPWLIRNYVRIGDTGPVVTTAGVHFWIGHHAGASSHNEAPYVFLGAYESMSGPDRERTANRDAWREGLEFAATHPFDEFAGLFKRVFWMMGDDEVALLLNENYGSNPFLTPRERDYWYTLSNAYYYALIELGVAGMAFARPLRDAGRASLLVLIAAWLGFHLLIYGDPRFHLPVEPVAAVFAAAALYALWGSLYARGRPIERDAGPARLIDIDAEPAQ